MNLSILVSKILITLVLIFGSILAHTNTLLEKEIDFIHKNKEKVLSYKNITIKDSFISYKEQGVGPTVLLLHGAPDSSLSWNEIIPILAKSGYRVIAPDLIGMGFSGKPSIEYTFEEVQDYLDKFIEKINIHDLIIVGHDVGAILGGDYARRNSSNVKGFVFMEAPLFAVPSYEELSRVNPDFSNFLKAIKTPNVGEDLIINQNILIDGFLFQQIERPLMAFEKQLYQAPFLYAPLRRILLMFARNLPVAGEPKAAFDLYNLRSNWMQTTNIPILIPYAEPGMAINKDLANFFAQTSKSVSSKFVSKGKHFFFIDRPKETTKVLLQWLHEIGM